MTWTTEQRAALLEEVLTVDCNRYRQSMIDSPHGPPGDKLDEFVRVYRNFVKGTTEQIVDDLIAAGVKPPVSARESKDTE